MQILDFIKMLQECASEIGDSSKASECVGIGTSTAGNAGISCNLFLKEDGSISQEETGISITFHVQKK